MSDSIQTGTRSVDRALSILDCFSARSNSFSLKELAQKCNLSSATTLRLARTLEDAQYLYRDPVSLQYRLGLKLARLSDIAFDGLDFIDVARPVMQRIAHELECASNLSVFRNKQRVTVAIADEQVIYRSISNVGDVGPLTRGAVGKALLAYLPDQEILDIIRQDPVVTMDDIKTIRKQGYCFSRDELGYGTNGAAAPVYNAHGEVVASVNLSNRAVMIPPEKESLYILRTVEMAKEISNSLGYVPLSEI